MVTLLSIQQGTALCGRCVMGRFLRGGVAGGICGSCAGTGVVASLDLEKIWGVAGADLLRFGSWSRDQLLKLVHGHLVMVNRVNFAPRVIGHAAGCAVGLLLVRDREIVRRASAFWVRSGQDLALFDAALRGVRRIRDASCPRDCICEAERELV